MPRLLCVHACDDSDDLEISNPWVLISMVCCFSSPELTAQKSEQSTLFLALVKRPTSKK